ncbi:MAG TPA: hypothetical protein VKY33_02835 [Flavobacterium sp.]|nr:hypothetical protein [Flavobacterium sp.]
MMQRKNYLIALLTTIMLFSCGQDKKDSLPVKPQDLNSVKTLIKGKKYTTQKTGFYGTIAVNDETTVNWIDIAEKKKQLAKNTNNMTAQTELTAAERELKFAVQFVNDTAATVFSNGTSIPATYAVDNIVDDYGNDKESVKIRLTYADPSFSFGNELASEMTFTFLVVGADEKSLLLQTPRTINRQPLISLLVAE